MINKRCLQCNKDFETSLYRIKNGRGKYCSKECVNLSYQKGVWKNCLTCRKKFYIRLSHAQRGDGMYCSRECYKPSIVFKKCFICNKKFQVLLYESRRGRGKYCSQKCRGMSRNNHIIKNCLVCKQKMRIVPSMVKNGGGRYCSRKCYFNSKEPTGIEKKLYEELKNKGLLFEKQYLVNNKLFVDAYIPSLNLIIEADGAYWHSLPKQVNRDKSKNAYLIKCGYNLLRLTELEINNNQFKKKILTVVN